MQQLKLSISPGVYMNKFNFWFICQNFLKEFYLNHMIQNEHKKNYITPYILSKSSLLHAYVISKLKVNALAIALSQVW